MTKLPREFVRDQQKLISLEEFKSKQSAGSSSLISEGKALSPIGKPLNFGRDDSDDDA